jgi:hypothetical protein
MSILRQLGYVAALSLLSLASVAPSYAQQKIDQKSLSKATWHESPREIQILDERPVIRDFREAPAAAQQIELPPGPQGSGGGYGGNGGGALGGGPPSLPAGGMQLGNGSGPGYRSAPQAALPKSGFGGPSNIPARGMAPAGTLPGVTKGVLGNIMAKPKGNGAGAGPAGGIAPPRGRSNGNSNGPAVASYGGYGTGSGTGTGAASSTESNVRGTLLKRH